MPTNPQPLRVGTAHPTESQSVSQSVEPYLTRHEVRHFRAGRRQPPGSSQEGLRPRTGGLTPPRSDVSSLTARGTTVAYVSGMGQFMPHEIPPST